MTKELIRKYRAAGMTVEIRQIKLAANAAKTETAHRRLFRVVNQLRALSDERKRLLNPRKPSAKASDWTPDKYVGSGGGAVDGMDDNLEGI